MERAGHLPEYYEFLRTYTTADCRKVFTVVSSNFKYAQFLSVFLSFFTRQRGGIVFICQNRKLLSFFFFFKQRNIHYNLYNCHCSVLQDNRENYIIINGRETFHIYRETIILILSVQILKKNYGVSYIHFLENLFQIFKVCLIVFYTCGIIRDKNSVLFCVTMSQCHFVEYTVGDC